MKRLAFIAAIFIALGTVSVWADSPGTPGPSGYTLSDIYDYLNSGSTVTIGGHSLEPPSGAVPGDTRFQTLNRIYDDIKAKFDQCTATGANVEEGKTFFSTQSASWGVRTGSKAAVPQGWSGACVWMAGDQSCPTTGWPVKHTRSVCMAYGVSGGGATSWGGGYSDYPNCVAAIKSCVGQGCSSDCSFRPPNSGQWTSVTNIAGQGYCQTSAIYTYCCAQ